MILFFCVVRAGIEPAHDGTKTRCLTAWLPDNVVSCTHVDYDIAGSLFFQGLCGAAHELCGIGEEFGRGMLCGRADGNGGGERAVAARA